MASFAVFRNQLGFRLFRLARRFFLRFRHDAVLEWERGRVGEGADEDDNAFTPSLPPLPSPPLASLPLARSEAAATFPPPRRLLPTHLRRTRMVASLQSTARLLGEFPVHIHLLGVVDFEDCLSLQRRLAYDAL